MAESLPEIKKESLPVGGSVASGGQLSPFEMMTEALKSGVDLDRMEKLMELQERHEEREAKKAYYAAVAAFKKDAPRIIKDMRVDFSTSKGRTAYNHASGGNVLQTLAESLSKHELSLSFKQTQVNGLITVRCTMSHARGHSDFTELSSAPDSSGGKNSIQAMSSANSYLQRYTALAISGIGTHEPDDDGRNADFVPMSNKQISEVTDMINEYVTNPSDFFGYLSSQLGKEIKQVEDIPSSAYAGVIKDLKGIAERGNG